MSKAKLKYLSAYVPEGKPKETPKRGGTGEGGGNGRIADIEAALAALNDLLAKQNRDNLDALYNLDMGNMSSSMKRLFQSYDDGITRAEAGIEAWANEMESGFRAVAEWQDETTHSLAQIEGKADANGASITSLTKFQNETVESLTQIKQESNAQKASIELLTQFKKDVEGGNIEALTSIKQQSDENAAQIALIAQWQKTVENGTISSIANINAKADNNAASITALNTWKNGANTSITAVQSLASQNEAQITFLASWKNTAEDEIDGLAETMAVIEATADENGARITQIVSAIGENGEVTFASIAAGVAEDESFVDIIADQIALKGFVTFESLENTGDGAATINGNNISLILDGELDDGETNVESKSALNFIYEHYRSNEWQKKEFAKIYTSIAGNDSDETSRYALNIDANKFINDLGDTVYASLKMDAAGRVSIKGQYGMYLGTYGTSGYITLDAIDNTRINANKTFSSASNSTAVAATDYSFNTDGIYYGPAKILGSDGSGSGGGTVTAVFG